MQNENSFNKPDWSFSGKSALSKISNLNQNTNTNSFSAISPLRFFKPKIFVHLAAYRDPEIVPTIQDAIEKADYPENINFGVVWQCLPEEDEEITKELKKLPCKIIEVNANLSLGACWARSLGQRLLHDEDFILQLDSHHRFDKGWDSLLIQQLLQCPSQKPILSAYTSPYTPPNNIPTGYVANRLTADKFNENGILCFIARESLDSYSEPQLGMFLAGGFIFAPRQFYLEIPYDPFLYFHGEEITLAMRAWTAGWDIFYPHKIVFYHYYTRSESKKHWDLNSEWYRIDERARGRIKKLLKLDIMGEDLEIYDLGKERTLEEYQAFSGINFAKQEISENAKKGIPSEYKLNNSPSKSKIYF